MNEDHYNTSQQLVQATRKLVQESFSKVTVSHQQLIQDILGIVRTEEPDFDCKEINEILQFWQNKMNQQQTKIFSTNLESKQIIGKGQNKEEQVEVNKQKEPQQVEEDNQDESFHFDSDSYSYESSIDDVDDDYRKEQESRAKKEEQKKQQ